MNHRLMSRRNPVPSSCHSPHPFPVSPCKREFVSVVSVGYLFWALWRDRLYSTRSFVSGCFHLAWGFKVQHLTAGSCSPSLWSIDDPFFVDNTWLTHSLADRFGWFLVNPRLDCTHILLFMVLNLWVVTLLSNFYLQKYLCYDS